MIDEAVLADLVAQVGDEIPVPGAGAERVVTALTAASVPSRRRARPRFTKPLLAAAAIFVVLLAAVPVVQNGSSSSKSSSVASPTVMAPDARARPGVSGSNASGGPSNSPVDAAKIVKTGTLDLQLPHGALRVTVNRVTNTAVGLGGYVANSRTSYGSDPTAQITVRVPANEFETAITRLDALDGVKVLGESENGTDVTAQYVDLQAQLAAATAGRDALLVVLSRAQTVGDILAVQDRVTAAQTQVEQLQRRINVLGDQAAFSSLGVTLSEKPAHGETAALHRTPDKGLSKAWADARHGFSSGIEWIIARSGGALIVLLAALSLLFGVRFLYPIVRRGLL